eukprot:2018356-Amphidinium_carterae.1
MASDGTYHPKYDLRHESSNATVLAFLQDLRFYVATDVAVTVTGRNVNGVLHDVVITQCTNTDSSDDAEADRGCDSVCTSACSSMALTVPPDWSTAMDDASSARMSFVPSIVAMALVLMMIA